MTFISHTLVTLALYALSSSAVPATSPVLEKRAVNCKITGNLARCRRSAGTSAASTIFGEFAAGTVRTETWGVTRDQKNQFDNYTPCRRDRDLAKIFDKYPDFYRRRSNWVKSLWRTLRKRTTRSRDLLGLRDLSQNMADSSKFTDRVVL
ncbi:hypothetical protein K438DRAFT_1757788 [Mycena galopus ATCC 62051]|nr:hypothetical protein K438DRAFT_1757788 [Mycena galopus ATCC 62051]